MENQNEQIELQLENHFETATVGQRFVNSLIDTLVIYAVFFLIFFILGVSNREVLIDIDEESPSMTLTFYLVYFLIMISYYTLFEFKKTKTLGKMITNTHVIREDGLPLTLRNCFLRTLARLVPFERWTVFSSSGAMWHDKWNETYVVKDKKY